MRREASSNSTIIPITVKNSAMDAPNTLVSVMAIQKQASDLEAAVNNLLTNSILSGSQGRSRSNQSGSSQHPSLVEQAVTELQFKNVAGMANLKQQHTANLAS